jgi:hypothetical protein
VIIRIIAIDPSPRDPRDDVIVYQVPEHSRAHELLVALLEDAGIEHVTIESRRRQPAKKKARAKRTRK